MTRQDRKPWSHRGVVWGLVLVWGGGWWRVGDGPQQSIHLFAAGGVVPACPLPAYLHPGKFFVVVSLDPDPYHT